VLGSETSCILKQSIYGQSIHGRSRSSKVVDFGTNQQRACGCLLVINIPWSHLAPFQTYCRFSADNSDPAPIFGRCTLWTRLSMLLLGGARPKLPPITLEVTQPIGPRYVSNVTDTDRRTDGQLTILIPRFALRASRCKKSHRMLDCMHLLQKGRRNKIPSSHTNDVQSVADAVSRNTRFNIRRSSRSM